MANGLKSIKLGVHGVERVELRQEMGASYKWLVIALIGEDESRAEITAFAGDAWPELSLARDYAPQTGREADCLHNASERYEPKTTELKEETNAAI